MTIRNTVKNSLAVYVVLTLFVSGAFLYQLRVMQTAVERMELSSEIAETVYRLQALVYDQLETPCLQRISKQWELLNDKLTAKLHAAIDDYSFDKRRVGVMLQDKDLANQVFEKYCAHGPNETDNRMVLLGSILSNRLDVLETEAGKFQHQYTQDFASTKRISELMVWGLTATIISVVLFNSLWIKRRVLVPLQILTDECLKISAGNMNQPVQIKSDNEFGLLAREFNNMTSNLNRSYQELNDEIDRRKLLESELLEHRENLELEVAQFTLELVSANEALKSEVETKETAQKNLAEYTSKLEQINRELDQFSYISSHHLQEPLRKIINFGELLERRTDAGMDERTRRYLGHMVDSSKRMKRLMEDLLLIINIDRYAPSKDNVDTNALVHGVISHLDREIRHAGAQVNVEYLPKLWADPKEMELLFTHLLDNALKFRRAIRPVIRIWSENDADTWNIGVRDNGIGFEPEYGEKIFQIFQRLHSPDKYPGTGIGLALCKKIVDRHGGRIWAASEPEKGSTFHFSIPGPNA